MARVGELSPWMGPGFCRSCPTSLIKGKEDRGRRRVSWENSVCRRFVLSREDKQGSALPASRPHLLTTEQALIVLRLKRILMHSPSSGQILVNMIDRP